MNKLSSLTTIALTAMLPSFASADVAASLSASFGNNAGNVNVGAGNAIGTVVNPTSVSVAGAAGGFAAASSVATAHSSGAAAGATSNADFPPIADVTYKNNANAYETSVSFAPSPQTIQQVADAAATQAIGDLCNAGFNVTNAVYSAEQSGTVGQLVNGDVYFYGVKIGTVGNGAVGIADGPIQVTMDSGASVSCN